MQILMEFCELKEEEDVLKDPYLSQQICYYHGNVAFSLETVKRVLWPQKKRCLQNYLSPHICS